VIIIKPIVICGNPKFDRLVIDCNFAAMAYMDKNINVQYREFKLELLENKKPASVVAQNGRLKK
jgi:hypothetical protein